MPSEPVTVEMWHYEHRAEAEVAVLQPDRVLKVPRRRPRFCGEKNTWQSAIVCISLCHAKGVMGLFRGFSYQVGVA
jgi:hypothetical protein